MSGFGERAAALDRRPFSAWGAFLGGQAAIGGNLFVALGLVVQACLGAAGAASAISGVIFLFVGLAWVEMVAAMPVAGGGQYYVQRALGDFWGFIAGATLLLDLTIGISLFAAMAASYANIYTPALLGVEARELTVQIAGAGTLEWFWLAEALVISLLLVGAHLRGLRVKSAFTTAVGVAVLAGLAVLVVGGLLLAWSPETLVATVRRERPPLGGLAYGLSLSVISFVGLQTLALTASECRRPSAVVPRPSLALILTTLLFAVTLPLLALGSSPTALYEHGEAPLSLLAGRIPPLPGVAAGLVAGLACVVLLVSANRFLSSLSQLVYSMGQYECLGPWSRRIHPTWQTPVAALAFAGAAVCVELVAAFLWPGTGPLEALANMYAFGATTAYSLAMVAVIRLRFTDPHLPRPFRVPVNVPIGSAKRRRFLPLPAIVALAGSVGLLAMVLATHEIGRIAGPGWLALWTAYYLFHRRATGLPLFGSVRRDWGAEQVRILEEAGERDLAATYSRDLAAERGGH